MEHCFVFAQEPTWQLHRWKSDAEFMYCCSANGRLNLLVLCNRTYAEFCGVRLVAAPKPVVRCEISASGGQLRVVSSEGDISVSQPLGQSLETGETIPQTTGPVDR